MPEKTPKTEKVPNPVAPRGDLPKLPAGMVWDTVEISGWDFAVAVAENVAGIVAICKGDEKVAAGLFNRALRIAVPARLDGRKVMDAAKDKEAAAKTLQADILAFDAAAVRERAPRTPKSVTIPAGQKTFSVAEVAALLNAQGIKTTVA